jgi:hypothetical protein
MAQDLQHRSTCLGGQRRPHDGILPLVMGKAPLLWLDNLPAECITFWETLSRLFTTNYQATYNDLVTLITLLECG